MLYEWQIFERKAIRIGPCSLGFVIPKVAGVRFGDEYVVKIMHKRVYDEQNRDR